MIHPANPEEVFRGAGHPGVDPKVTMADKTVVLSLWSADWWGSKWTYKGPKVRQLRGQESGDGAVGIGKVESMKSKDE